MVERASRFMQYVDVTPVVDLAAYSSGDLIGHAVMEFDLDKHGKVEKGGILQSVIITDLAKQNATLDVVFFATNPTATSFTDQAEFDIDDADLIRIIGVATVSDWKSFKDNSVGQELQLALPFIMAGGNTLYGAIVARGTPDFVSTSDLTIRIGVLSA